MIGIQRIVVVTVVGLLGSTIIDAQESTPSPAQVDFARVLDTGSPDERNETVSAIQRMAPDARHPIVIEALVSEAQRLAVGASEPPYPLYDRDVVKLLSEADDPRVIRPCSCSSSAEPSLSVGWRSLVTSPCRTSKRSWFLRTPTSGLASEGPCIRLSS